MEMGWSNDPQLGANQSFDVVDVRTALSGLRLPHCNVVHGAVAQLGVR